MEDSKAHDRIEHLPGLGAVQGEQYAGYVPVVPTEDGSAAGGDQLFYWLAGPDSDATRPVILWTNGGPGSSSFWGIFTENGPYRIDGDGTAGNTKLVPRAEAWSNHAHYLVIEHPLGCTLSFARPDSDLPSSAREGCEQYYHALVNVLKRLGLAEAPIIITGESFGGTYLPLLANRILKGKELPNFRGAVICDGWVDPLTQMRCDTDYAVSRGLISDEQKQVIDKNFAIYPSPYNGTIASALRKKGADAVAAGTLPAELELKYLGYYGIVETISDWAGGMYMTNIAAAGDPPFSNAITYINRADVRDALHVPAGSPPVDKTYAAHAWDTWDQSQSMIGELNQLLDHSEPEVTLLVISGLNDAKDCNWMGTRDYLHDAERFHCEAAETFRASGVSPWKLSAGAGARTGGFEQGTGRLRWLKVLNAGHMAVMDQPELINYILDRFGFSGELA